MKALYKSIIVLTIFSLLLSSFSPFFSRPVFASESCSSDSSSTGSTTSTSVQSYPSARVGGVALDQTATFLADMTDITGAYYDQADDRIVFIGKKNTSAPKFDKDDLAVAIRAVIFNKVLPAVSIDYDENDPNNTIVTYRGGIGDTAFGKVLFDADWKLKKYTIGSDENGQSLTSGVSNYASVQDRYISLGPNPNYPRNSSRFWISPELVSVKRDDANDSFIFDEVKMHVESEPQDPANDPAWNQAMTDFVVHHTQYYDQFAAETPAYADAKQLGKIVAVVKWIADEGIATDFQWARDYEPKYIDTPDQMPKIQGLASEFVYNGTTYISRLSGGVEYYTSNSYTQDTGESSSLKTTSESVSTPKEEIHWTFTKDATEYEAVAVAADAFRSLGSYNTSATDMLFPTAGDLTLSFQRSYSSYSGGQYGVGRGWSILPAALYDNKPGNPPKTITCTDGIYPEAIAFASPSGGFESFTISDCNIGYVPDDPSYHSGVVRNGDGTFMVTLKNQTQVNFLSNFRLSTIKDKNGNTITYSYDANGKLTSISDSKNHQLTLSYNARGFISTLSDWSGRIVTYGYDEQGNLLTVTDPRGNVTTYTYDTNFKLTSIKNRNQVTLVSNTYTPEAKLASQTDVENNAKTYTYDETTRKVVTTDTNARASEMTYDTKARILQEKDPLFQITTYTYGTELSPLSITDKKNNKTTFTYDGNGNTTSVLYPNTVRVTYEYDSKNRVTRILDDRYKNVNGNVARETKFTYDQNGNVTQSQVAALSTSYGYDSSGEVITVTDPRVKTTTYTRDAFGNMLSLKDAANNITTYEYDVLGRLTRQTDPKLTTVVTTRDANDNVLTVTTAAGITTNTFDAENQLTSVVSPTNTTTQFSYSPGGVMDTVTDAFASQTHYSYDDYLNMISRQDSLNNVTTYIYDNLNRETESRTPLGNVSTWEYDANGNIAKRIDGNNQATVYTYDVLNRLTKITYPTAQSVTYTYDNRGNPLTMVDPTGTTTYTYDVYDRLLSVKNPYGRTISYQYDTTDNLTKITYPDSRAVNYSYDDTNKLTAVTDWNGKKTTYTYFENNLVQSRTYPNGIATHYAYDASNRLSNLEHIKTGTTLAKFTYARDELGNITSVTEEGTFFPTPTVTVTPTPTPTGSGSTPTPTPTGSVPTSTPTSTPTPTPSGPTPTPTPVTNAPDLVVTNVTTNPSAPVAGQSFITTATVKNIGTLTTGTIVLQVRFNYDMSSPTNVHIATSRGKTITLLPGQSTILTDTRTLSTEGTYDLKATVDPSNYVVETNEGNNIFGPFPLVVSAFSAFNDDAGTFVRIARLFTSFGVKSAYAQQQYPQYVSNFTYDALSRIKTADYPDDIHYTYSYDTVGNRVLWTLAIGSAVGTGNNAYDADSQLTTAGQTTFTHDGNGNRKQRVSSSGTTNYSFNLENRITGYTPPTGSATAYTYDGNQNRIQKKVGTATTRYVNDTSGTLSRVLAETNSSNSITKSYIYGNGLLSQGTTGSSSRYYYLEDGQGNARFLTDYNGNKVRSNEYDPFGGFRSANGLAAMHMLYQTQQSDGESGLYYLRARYYDPLTATFLSRDPIRGTLTNPQSQNPYAYALNNPVNLGDPSGLWAVGGCLGGNIGIGAYGSCSICGVITSDRELGAVVSVGGGGSTGLATGVGPQGLYSTANNLEDIKGVDIFSGGSAWVVGADGAFSVDDPTITTYTAGPSYGPDLSPPFLPIEFHAGASHSWVFPLLQL